MAAILVYGAGISSFLFKYFVLFHHPTGATDHVSENDLSRAHIDTSSSELTWLPWRNKVDLIWFDLKTSGVKAVFQSSHEAPRSSLRVI
jgi:hypothetical protein